MHHRHAPNLPYLHVLVFVFPVDVAFAKPGFLPAFRALPESSRIASGIQTRVFILLPSAKLKLIENCRPPLTGLKRACFQWYLNPFLPLTIVRLSTKSFVVTFAATHHVHDHDAFVGRLERAILKYSITSYASLENPKRKVLGGQDIDGGTIAFANVLFHQIAQPLLLRSRALARL